MAASAVLFDAYGTLFDVYSVATTAEQLFPGNGIALANLWREKQLDYTRLRTLAGRYDGFDQITADALAMAGDVLKLDITEEQGSQLMGLYWRLPVFKEVKPVLEGLKTLGITTGILSNGTPAMLDNAIEANKLKGLFRHVLSVDSIRKFKIAPEAYQLGVDATKARPGSIVFVSSNHWDICGAGWFGFKTYWCNRAGALPERLGVAANRTGKSLNDLVNWVES